MWPWGPAICGRYWSSELYNVRPPFISLLVKPLNPLSIVISCWIPNKPINLRLNQVVVTCDCGLTLICLRLTCRPWNGTGDLVRWGHRQPPNFWFVVDGIDFNIPTIPIKYMKIRLFCQHLATSSNIFQFLVDLHFFFNVSFFIVTWSA